MITKTLFDKYDGKDVYLYELSNDCVKVGICNFGGAVHSIKLKTKNGEKDVCLGYNSVKDYLESSTFCGAIIGRVGNRIRNGKFNLNGNEYNVTINDGVNHLHGGTVGFDKRFFDVEINGNSLVLSLISADGDQGYPANLNLTVTYTLTNKTLEIKFSAISDKDTIWNPTSHTYFNLDGEESGNIYSTTLKINADKFTPCDDQIIPTGKIEYVFDTDYDFTTARNVGKAIAKHGGYDDNFILNGILAATAVGGKSGVALNVYTNLPAMQFYSGNFIKGKGKSREYFPHDGFCLEPQYVPNAINIAGVDKPILKAGKEKTYYIKYEFDF